MDADPSTLLVLTAFPLSTSLFIVSPGCKYLHLAEINGSLAAIILVF